MDFADSPEQARWRKEVRDFIETQLPPELQGAGKGPTTNVHGPEAKGRPESMKGGAGYSRGSEAMSLWRSRLAERGWVAPAWPEEYGGAGLGYMEQAILNEEFAKTGAPRPGGTGVTQVGPTIILNGTDEQKQEFIPRILRGDIEWCQGFSEPGAGSDLASLQTRAVLDGDEWVVNGQKIWTSGAHKANMIYLIVRTDPEAPKHRGITYLIADMSTPGITIRPLVNMAGVAGFNEVFFDDVRVPATNVVGEVNRGWYVATTTLDFERSNIGSAVGTLKTVDRLVRRAREQVDTGFSMVERDPQVRLGIADRHIEANVANLLSHRVISMQNAGLVPNYESSMAKLYFSELEQRITRTGLKLVGLFGNIWSRDGKYSPFRASYAHGYVGAVASTIGGGTSEIQRNVIATRGLGLPRS